MSNEEQMVRLRRFACQDKHRSISAVMIKDGMGYATDGRLLVRERLDEKCDDIVTRDDGLCLPVDEMVNLAKHPDAATKWYRFPKTEFEAFSTEVEEAYKAKIAENNSFYRDRYKCATCPSCGEYMWWDDYEDWLVSEKEPPEKTTLPDVQLPVRFKFSEKDEADVNFAYIYMVHMAYGDVLFSISRPDNYSRGLLLMKALDGKMQSVLMPLRVYDSYENMKCAEMEEAADADGRTA